MRILAAAIILAILACALLASNAHKPFDLRTDEHSPGVWQANVGVKPPPIRQQMVVICHPMIITIGPKPKHPITRT